MKVAFSSPFYYLVPKSVAKFDKLIGIFWGVIIFDAIKGLILLAVYITSEFFGEAIFSSFHFPSLFGYRLG